MSSARILKLTIADFLDRWRLTGAAERANKDSFLAELCDVLGVEHPHPKTNDPAKDVYVFEKDVRRSKEDGASIGAIDLYRAGCFVLEAKQVKPEKRETPAWHQAMNDAYGQALGYARSLDAPPPFVVVADLGFCFDLYASFDGSGAYRPFPDAFRKRLYLADLERHTRTLRALWTDPLSLDPARVQAKVTREVAARIAGLARELESAGHDPELVARFLMRCLFTLFAEDVGLLPEKIFTRSLDEHWLPNPPSFAGGARSLWRAMNEGGDTLAGKLLRFNGGLFADADTLALSREHLGLLRDAARSDWAEVDPSIFGTLLERALDPRERHRLGAHYTPRAYVERLVKPTIEEPLREDWDLVRAEVRALVEAGELKAAQEKVIGFHHKLCATRVLDPACGTGNFLYVTLDLFKRLETEILELLKGLGYDQIPLEMERYSVTPEQFRGIEVKRWAKEIAELVLWIGYLQWQTKQSGDARTIPEPVLRDYGNIECRDAVLAWDGDAELARDKNGNPITRWDGVTYRESPVTGDAIPDENARVPIYVYDAPRRAEWPSADFIVGNPPYIGNKRMRLALGDGYVDALRAAWTEVPQNADYVIYWWRRAAELVSGGQSRQFGLITTNSLTQTFNRKVVEEFVRSKALALSFAVPDHPWVDEADGAAVRVALTVGRAGHGPGRLRSVSAERPNAAGEIDVEFADRSCVINPDLTCGADTTDARRLVSNRRLAYMGVTPAGEGFRVELPEFGSLGLNPATLPPAVRKYRIGRDLVQRPVERYIIDFSFMSESEARERYPALFQKVYDEVRPLRLANADKNVDTAEYAARWWQFAKIREGLRSAITGLPRYIGTCRTAKHRVFVFLEADILPDAKIIAIGLPDAWFLGVLSSRVHLLWAARVGAFLGVGNDLNYNHSDCFETFPFPSCSETLSTRVREIGQKLEQHRQKQLAQYPGLTLTRMYNVLEKLRSGEVLTEGERSTYDQGLVSVLMQIHDELDVAVFEAYGWPTALSDEEILDRLVALNRLRAEEEKSGIVRWLRPEFQNAGDAKVAVQAEMPTATSKKSVEPSVARDGKRQWPKELPAQVAAVRDLLAGRGPVDLASAKAAFKKANVDQLTAALDSLAALGLAVAASSGPSKTWSAVS